VLTRLGSATAGIDFEEVAQVVDFGVGELTKTVLVPIRDDGLVEADETVEVILASSTDGQVFDDSPATLIILDNEKAVVVDASFIPPPGLWPQQVMLQPDGKLFVVGEFWNGEPWPGIGRLNSDGSIDRSFQPAGFTRNPSASSITVALQSDGGILLSGGLLSEPGRRELKLARLTASGALDGGFSPAFLFDPNEEYVSVARIVVQLDRRILIAGHYHTANEFYLPGLSRLLPDGRQDETFAGQESAQSQAAAGLNSFDGLALQGDQGIIVAMSGFGSGGVFGRLIRLLPDGRVDSSFIRRNARGSHVPWRSTHRNGFSSEGRGPGSSTGAIGGFFGSIRTIKSTLLLRRI
jgi:uncharacterized delta-60 repeat protein